MALTGEKTSEFRKESKGDLSGDKFVFSNEEGNKYLGSWNLFSRELNPIISKELDNVGEFYLIKDYVDNKKRRIDFDTGEFIKNYYNNKLDVRRYAISEIVVGFKCTHVYETFFSKETGLSPYGRIRANTCAGGFKGCFGEVHKRNQYNEPYCLNCWNVEEQNNDIKTMNDKKGQSDLNKRKEE